MSREKKNESRGENIPVLASSSDNGELSRLMDSYAEMTSPWMLPALRLPMFPYWRDVDVRSPKVDVVDYGDKFLVTVELPGFEKEDIDLTVNGFSLEINAEMDLQEKGKTKNYVQRERLHSSYHRVIQLPREVTPSKAKATLKSGLLEVEIPKIEPSRERSRKIAVH